MEYFAMLINKNTAEIENIEMEWIKYNIGFFCVEDTVTAIKELSTRNYALITMVAEHFGDMLPDSLRVIRSIYTIPIQVLTSAYNAETQLTSIKLGADQYIAMPETVEEYVMSGLALVRRYLECNEKVPPPPQMMEHSGLLLCVDYFRVFVYGQEIILTPKEYDILLLLMEHKHRVITYQQMYEKLWGAEYVDEPQHKITNFVSKLKKKLQIDSTTPEYIRNVYGVGYRFNP